MDWSFSISFAIDQCILPVLLYLCGKADGICKLEDNLVVLRREFNDLIAKRDGVLNKVKAEELKGRQKLPVVVNWLSEVQTIETNINQLFIDASAQEAPTPNASVPDTPAQDAPAQQAPNPYASVPYTSAQDAPAQEALAPDAPAQNASNAHQRLSPWSKNIFSTYYRAEMVLQKLDEVRSLSLGGVFEEVTAEASPPVVEEESVQHTFGLDTKLQRTWSSLMEDDIRILGLYGMGGVGKTRLLTLIENKFADDSGRFDVVIWVKVSKDADILKIQDDIGKRLGIYDENWSKKFQREKASDIRRVLKHMKPRFVLLLDDLWEEVNLTAIGIPLLGNGYKVVFTTRSKNVCGRMEASENIEVKCLAEKDAWDLFKQKARCGILNGVMLDLAKKIAVKCCGLPLALEVIGKTMASNTTIREWRHALNTLDSFPREMDVTERHIFPVLKLSYDKLKKNDAKCFQYCALFPKAYNIKQDELVEYWIGEGFIDEKDGRERAKDRGYDTINTLVKASLLLEDGESKQKVYMHNMVREMALWILSEYKDGERFVVKTDARLSHLPDVTDWTTVTKMSLMNNDIVGISDSLQPPNPARLITLFLQNNKLVIVGEFFLVMSTLVVLDLSQNLNITELPADISKLVALRYLNLLGTGIKNLPISLGALDKLIHLDLESTSNLESICPISRLLKLQVLRFYRSSRLDLNLLNILEGLGDLKLLTITVEEDFDVLEAFLGSNSARHTEGLYLNRLEFSEKSFAATFGTLGSLSKLGMTECSIIDSETGWKYNGRDKTSPSTSSNPCITPSDTWFKNLSAVVLLSCEGLTDLTWLIYAANLQSLSITLSPKLEEIISKEKAGNVVVDGLFQKLQVLDLVYLDKLKSIYWSPLSFPCLQKVYIASCPELQNLPLSVERMDALRIKLDDGWWLQRVDWERGA